MSSLKLWQIAVIFYQVSYTVMAFKKKHIVSLQQTHSTFTGRSYDDCIQHFQLIDPRKQDKPSRSASKCGNTTPPPSSSINTTNAIVVTLLVIIIIIAIIIVVIVIPLILCLRAISSNIEAKKTKPLIKLLPIINTDYLCKFY